MPSKKAAKNFCQQSKSVRSCNFRADSRAVQGPPQQRRALRSCCKGVHSGQNNGQIGRNLKKPFLDFLPLDPRGAAAACGADRGPVRANHRQEHSESSFFPPIFRASQSPALTSAQAYLGFTHKRDAQTAKDEWARFAVQRRKKDIPAFTRRDKTRLKTWEDLQAIGFEVQWHAAPVALANTPAGGNIGRGFFCGQHALARDVAANKVPR